MLKTMLFIILLLVTLRAMAPEARKIFIEKEKALHKLENLWRAVCTIESGNNRYAYFMEADGWPAVGIAQIREVRLRDYNSKTNHRYQMKDLYDPAVSKEIFIYYFSQHNDMDLAIRRWQGSGPMTFDYLKRVKSAL